MMTYCEQKKVWVIGNKLNMSNMSKKKLELVNCFINFKYNKTKIVYFFIN